MKATNSSREIKLICKAVDENLNIKHAQKILDDAFLTANDINDEVGVGWCQLLFGIIKSIKGEYSLANEYFEITLSIAHKNDDVELEVEVLKNLGDLRYLIHDYDSALEYYLSCLDRTSSVYNGYCGKGQILLRMGHIYKELEQYIIAIEYYEEVLKICLEGDRKKIGESELYADISRCYIGEGDLIKAGEYILKSINVALDNDYNLAYAYMVYAKYHYEFGDYKESRNFYEKAIKKASNLGENELLLEIMAEYGAMLFTIGNIKEAEKVLSETSLLSLNQQNYAEEIKIYYYLAKIYEKQGLHKKALDYFKRYNEIKTVNDETWKTIKTNNIVNKYEYIRNDIKVKELINKNENLLIFSNLGKDITASLNKEEIVEKVSKSIFELLKCNQIGIGFLNEKELLEYTISDNVNHMEVIIDTRNKSKYINYLLDNPDEFLDNDFSYAKITSNKPLTVDKRIFSNVRSLMSCPLIFEDTIIGVINVTSDLKDSFTESSLEILKIMSSYISIAIHNSVQSKKIIDANKLLKELTEKDALTKVYNRYALTTNVKRIFRKAYKYDKPYSAIMIDVDFFKEYNDHYGHLRGDDCLILVSHALKNVCGKDTKYIYRFGGDEFLIILLNKNIKEAQIFAESLRASVERLKIDHLFSEVSPVVTLTLGVATITKKIDSHEDVFALADKALYIAKSRGRNNVKQLTY